MKTTHRAPRVAGRAATVLERTAIVHGPYLEALAGGSMPLETFRVTQEQFFHAVTFFPRPMAAEIPAKAYSMTPMQLIPTARSSRAQAELSTPLNARTSGHTGSRSTRSRSLPMLYRNRRKVE